MLKFIIPGGDERRIDHLVLDFNGTLAYDGTLIPGVAERLSQLATQLTIHVITADTFGSVAHEIDSLPCTLSIIPQESQDKAKSTYIEELGAATVAAIGNGRNDQLMLTAASLGIAVMHREGTAVRALLAADLVIPDILAALDLLLHPKRLIATLRN
ncbi:MAG: ATPase P [Desulfuromonadales bacterium]|nr:ATPase P [Desulfuromonadales bacterium]MBN2792850.1 ATPase P [Desulfuromonadales bacterium]